MGQSVRGRFEFQGPCHGICSPALCSSCTLCPFLDYVSQVHFCCRAPFVLFPVVSVCLAPLPSHLSNVETLTVFSGLYNPGQPQCLAHREWSMNIKLITKWWLKFSSKSGEKERYITAIRRDTEAEHLLP